jgi:hypothetical protein
MRRRAGLALLVVLLVGGGLWAARYRRTYHVWPGQSAGSRVGWCGRVYLAGDTFQTRAQAEAGSSHPLTLIGHYPPINGEELWAAVTPAKVRNAVRPPLPCAMAVYLRAGTDRFRGYELSGGP